MENLEYMYAVMLLNKGKTHEISVDAIMGVLRAGGIEGDQKEAEKVATAMIYVDIEDTLELALIPIAPEPVAKVVIEPEVKEEKEEVESPYDDMFGDLFG